MTDLILGTISLIWMVVVATLAAIVAADCAVRGALDNALFDAGVAVALSIFAFFTYRDVKKLRTARKLMKRNGRRP